MTASGFKFRNVWLRGFQGPLAGRTELKSPCQHWQWSDGQGINQTSIMIPKYPRACYAAAAHFLGRMATPIRYSSAMRNAIVPTGDGRAMSCGVHHRDDRSKSLATAGAG